MSNKAIFFAMALIGLLLVWAGGKQAEWAGSPLILFGLTLFFVGGIFAAGGVIPFFCGVAVLFFLYFMFVGGGHVGWWGPWHTPYTVTRPGYHGNGDFVRPFALAAVLGIGVFALLYLGGKSAKDKADKSGH